MVRIERGARRLEAEREGSAGGFAGMASPAADPVSAVGAAACRRDFGDLAAREAKLGAALGTR